MRQQTRTISIDVRLDLRRTLRPLGGRFLEDGWWLTARTPAGPGTLHLRRPGDVVAAAWGDGATWLLDRAPQIVGMDDDPDELVTDVPMVADLLRRQSGVRFGATGLVFDALVVAILGQKVTGKEAKRGVRGIWSKFSQPAPGPRDLRLPPDPKLMAEAPYYEYHPLGVEKKRADTLRRAAAESDRIEQLRAVDSLSARTSLERIPGIGVWTSAETVAISHGDADAVSVGDFHHKNLVAWHLAGRPRGTDEEMLELLEPFRPHRGRVVRLLETLGHAPSFGPRMPIRSIEKI